MITFLTNVAILFVVYLLADFFSKVMIASLIHNNVTFVDFVKGMQRQVYIILVVGFLVWFFYREASTYSIFFFICFLINFARLDYNDAEENYAEAREVILNSLKE